jgi:hypothetical protein
VSTARKEEARSERPQRFLRFVQGQIGEHEAHIVDATTADGISEAMYCDVDTGLLVRPDVTAEGTTYRDVRIIERRTG